VVALRKNIRSVVLTATASLLLCCGCVSTYQGTYLSNYRAGRLDNSERLLTPILEEEIAKDNKNVILYLWEMGMIRFAQGNYLQANEAFLKTDHLLGYEPGSIETGAELFSSDASKRFIGDPVEASVAFLLAGLGFYMMEDYQNALVSFKKSLEWDFSTEEENKGNMVITNLMIGECYSRKGEADQAIVAFRRVIRFNPEFVPGYLALDRELRKLGRAMQVEENRRNMAKLVSPDYLAQIDRHEDHLLLIMLSGDAPPVKAEGHEGMFRKRDEAKDPLGFWKVRCDDDDMVINMSMTDNLLMHFKDQGGETGQAVRKGTQAAAGAIMEEIPILGLFAPSTKADLRYWHTSPGKFFAGYIPIDSGLHTISVLAYDYGDSRLNSYRQVWHYIPVQPGENNVLVLVSFRNMQDLM